MTIAKKRSKLTDTENKLVVTSCGEGQHKSGGVQTTECNTGYTNVLYNMGKIANIYNNYKWSITFKNCESLCCTFVTYITLYSNCTSVKMQKISLKRKKRHYLKPIA